MGKENKIILISLIIILLLNLIIIFLLGFIFLGSGQKVEEKTTEKIETYTIDDCVALVYDTDNKYDDCVEKGLLEIYGYVVGEGCIWDKERTLCTTGRIADNVIDITSASCREHFPQSLETFTECFSKVNS